MPHSDAYRVYVRRQQNRGFIPLTERHWLRSKLAKALKKNPDPTYADFLTPWQGRRTPPKRVV